MARLYENAVENTVMSIESKLTKIQGLKPGDLTPWEAGFVQSVSEQVEERNGDTTHLSDRQVLVIERIYAKHFGG